jgi:hypothetical protein
MVPEAQIHGATTVAAAIQAYLALCLDTRVLVCLVKGRSTQYSQL